MVYLALDVCLLSAFSNSQQIFCTSPFSGTCSSLDFLHDNTILFASIANFLWYDLHKLNTRTINRRPTLVSLCYFFFLSLFIHTMIESFAEQTFFLTVHTERWKKNQDGYCFSCIYGVWFVTCVSVHFVRHSRNSESIYSMPCNCQSHFELSSVCCCLQVRPTNRRKKYTETKLFQIRKKKCFRWRVKNLMQIICKKLLHPMR